MWKFTFVLLPFGVASPLHGLPLTFFSLFTSSQKAGIGIHQPSKFAYANFVLLSTLLLHLQLELVMFSLSALITKQVESCARAPICR